MNKLIKVIPILLSALVFVACGGSDDGGEAPVPNTAPTAVSNLVYPSSDLLCIDTTILFEWSAATDVDNDVINYRLTVATDRNLTNIVEQIPTTSTTRLITLEPATAYYWNVVAFDGEDEAEASPTLAFYTEGTGVSNYAPFAASINAPGLDAFLDAGTTVLDWTGSDVDASDALTYDLFFGETADPVLVQSGLATSTFDVTTVAATTYYWRVDTTDDSDVKSIGQVWSFSTN
ncbi:fibronectin type III domain-containing protein [Psychroserpens sp. NJDZ02]|uniref:fibronectin type III domain-containing protein n=1 Tax=Psychroserpens sp. NJDZ02 TaxID=2570561 RepID=UPI0010A944CF|nr:fibronectin type III domain-containing protein [Psychroserpens sp. NJDZ02]QCE40805.1 fibronectin type III domain-containing protein [Psychroserpens sp. NJDZ02]